MVAASPVFLAAAALAACDFPWTTLVAVDDTDLVVRDAGPVLSVRLPPAVSGVAAEELVLSAEAPWAEGCVSVGRDGNASACPDVRVFAKTGGAAGWAVAAFVAGRLHLARGRPGSSPDGGGGEVVVAVAAGPGHMRVTRQRLHDWPEPATACSLLPEGTHLSLGVMLDEGFVRAAGGVATAAEEAAFTVAVASVAMAAQTKVGLAVTTLAASDGPGEGPAGAPNLCPNRYGSCPPPARDYSWLQATSAESPDAKPVWVQASGPLALQATFARWAVHRAPALPTPAPPGVWLLVTDCLHAAPGRATGLSACTASQPTQLAFWDSGRACGGCEATWPTGNAAASRRIAGCPSTGAVCAGPAAVVGRADVGTTWRHVLTQVLRTLAPEPFSLWNPGVLGSAKCPVLERDESAGVCAYLALAGASCADS